MLKSEMFRLAQMAVIDSSYICIQDKPDILRVLACEEDIQKLCEKQREKKESEGTAQ